MIYDFVKYFYSRFYVDIEALPAQTICIWHTLSGIRKGEIFCIVVKKCREYRVVKLAQIGTRLESLKMRRF